MGITNTIASSTSTTKAQQQSPTTKQATMNKSVGLALLALVCLAQASAALPFSSPHSEAERLARAEHQLRLRLNELAMKERLAKLESSFPKAQTRTLQSKLDGEALFNHDDGALFDKLRKANEEIQAAHGEDLVDSEGRSLQFTKEEREQALREGFTSVQSELNGEAEFQAIRVANMIRRQQLQEQEAAFRDSMDNLADSQGRALLFSEEERERLQASVHKTITDINDEVLRKLGRGRALQVHNIARGINAASKAAVVAGAVTDNKDMMKAGVAATAISGAAKIATRPALGSPLGRAVRKGKRKLRRGIRRALRG